MTNTDAKPFQISDGKLYIGGEWRDASDGGQFPTINPANEEVIAKIAKGTEEDTKAAIAAARHAFDEGDWGKMKGSERAKIMNKVADLIEARGDEIAYRESVDMGMLLRDARNIVVPHTAAMFRYYAGWATKIEGAVKPVEGHTPVMAYTRQEALGVVAAITPFNFPMILSVSKITPALAAGNAFIHKPATLTPLTALALAEIMEEAGMPAGGYNLVTGPGSTIGRVLVESPDVDKIAVTGSTETGKSIIRSGADTLKHVTAELGGKSPNIVMADADMDAAVATSFLSMFWNKGEVCVAGSRILVQRPVYETFVSRFAAMVQGCNVGDPLDETTHYGPMSDQSAFQSVLKYIEDGVAEGARLVTGGKAKNVNGKGFFIEPTIFADVKNEMKIAQEEIFGPVVCVIPFDTPEEAIAIANDSPYGLAAGVQSANYKTAINIANELKAGTIWINTWHKYDPSAPFGGYKHSGYGREQGYESLQSYLQTKTIWLGMD